MVTKRLLCLLLSGIIPSAALSQSSPPPAASATGAATKPALPPVPTPPVQKAPDAAELTKLLNDFLAGASKNDTAMHERFWADDLIYTSALGRRKGKADIMRELRSGEAPTSPKPGEEQAVYTAEEIRIQQYGETAIVAFRLVATTDKPGSREVKYFFNTGTFLKRNGKWQAAAWQATAIPTADEKKP